MSRPDATAWRIGVHGCFDDGQTVIVAEIARRLLEIQPDLVSLRLDVRGARSCSPRSLVLLAALLERGASLEGERVGLDGRGPARCCATTQVVAARAADRRTG